MASADRFNSESGLMSSAFFLSESICYLLIVKPTIQPTKKTKITPEQLLNVFFSKWWYDKVTCEVFKENLDLFKMIERPQKIRLNHRTFWGLFIQKMTWWDFLDAWATTIVTLKKRFNFFISHSKLNWKLVAVTVVKRKSFLRLWYNECG